VHGSGRWLRTPGADGGAPGGAPGGVRRAGAAAQQGAAGRLAQARPRARTPPLRQGKCPKPSSSGVMEPTWYEISRLWC